MNELHTKKKQYSQSNVIIGNYHRNKIITSCKTIMTSYELSRKILKNQKADI